MQLNLSLFSHVYIFLKGLDLGSLLALSLSPLSTQVFQSFGNGLIQILTTMILFDGNTSMHSKWITVCLKCKMLWDTECRLGHMLLDTELHPIQVGAHPRRFVVPVHRCPGRPAGLLAGNFQSGTGPRTLWLWWWLL